MRETLLIIGFYLLFETVLRVLQVVNFTNFEIEILLYGLRMDTVVISALMLPTLILLIVKLNGVARLYSSIGLSLLLSFELISLFYFSEFFERPAESFIEYLEYPEAVFQMLLGRYGVELIVLSLLIVVLPFAIFKIFKFRERSSVTFLLILLPLLMLGGRSSIDSATPNQSFYRYSKNEINNQLANNSVFSLLFSLYSLGREEVGSFGEISKDRALEVADRGGEIVSSYPQKEKIVLIQLESFGREFVGVLGGEPMTPNLDRWSKEGYLFTDIHSTGMRTNRGVEATISSIPPAPSRTYLKRQRAESGFWTVAESLKREGYRTVFLYGGDSKFDNMRAFMLSNGFDEVVDIYDFKGSKRYGWGVSDGDLMTMAEEILKSSREKLFLYVVTLSSHEPFLYPEAVVEADKRFKIQGFENSTKYTDYVVGKFLESVDLNSSIVGLIGDHPPKVKSPYPVPVDRFQVFGLILGGQKGVYSGLSSQIDFVPTLLDMGGVSTKLPAFGFSVLKVEPRRAVMAYRKNFALLTEDSFVLYRPEEKPQQFNLNYQPIENNSSTVEKGLSLLYGAEFLYRDREYRVDD